MSVLFVQDWDRERDVETKNGGRAAFEMDDEMFRSIVEKYRHGMSCVDISISCSIPYSVVYQVIRNHIPNREIKV